MNRPRVAHLLPAYNPFPPVYAAGTELRVEQVSLRQERYSPVVICGAFQGQKVTESLNGMKIRRIQIGRFYRRVFQKITNLDPIPYAKRMWRVIREEQAGIIHIHNEPKLLSELAKNLLKEPIPAIMHVANEKPLHRENIPLVHRWIACSEYIKKWLMINYRINGEKISTIYTGVDIAKREPWWKFSADLRRQIRAEAGIREEQAVAILFAGRLVREKGLSELLDAFLLLQERTSFPIHLLIAGNVRESKDPKNEKTIYGKAITQRIDKEKNVKWVGSLSPDQVHRFLIAGDIFVLPSIWPDPFPTVMLEAAAAGLPIVGSDRGGIPEFLKECPGTCLVHEPENPDSWVAGLETLSYNSDLRREAGQWLRRKVESSFGWGRVTQEIEDLYDRVLERP